MNKKISFLVLLVVLVVIVWAFWAQFSTLFSLRSSENTETVACTMDAMQCPDGRWVGRTGPNCEFVC